MRRFLTFVAVVAMLAIAACGRGDLTLDEADPDAVAENPTWNQVFSIFQRECAPCHTDNEDEEDEEDEPEDRSPGIARIGGVEPDLQTCLTIIDNLDDALESIFDKNDMPPGAWPRLTSEEKLIIQRWVDQGAVSPCN